MSKPKMLWHSNSPKVKTGYGAQTALFAPLLKEHFDITISAFYGSEGHIDTYNGIAVLPALAQTHGNETIRDHAGVVFGEDDGLVVTLMDVWVLDPQLWSEFNVVSWVPVDHEPAPRPVTSFFTNSGAIPLAMSRFGETELKAAGLDPLYVPHGIDTSVFCPVENAREQTGMPEDDFIVGMVAANKGNPSRKCFEEAFRGFKVLHDRHPDTKLYLHSEISGRFGGVNLLALANDVGIPSKALLVCDQYRASHYPHSDDAMAAIYSSLDVLLAPSAGEGFGIPVVEAQACGVPVIVSNFSAQPELVGAGWMVEGTRHYTAIGAWQVSPHVEEIAECLQEAYGQPEKGVESASKMAREFAEGYDVGRVFGTYMLPALAEARQRLEDRPVELVA